MVIHLPVVSNLQCLMQKPAKSTHFILCAAAYHRLQGFTNQNINVVDRVEKWCAKRMKSMYKHGTVNSIRHTESTARKDTSLKELHINLQGIWTRAQPFILLMRKPPANRCNIFFMLLEFRSKTIQRFLNPFLVFLPFCDC